MWGWWNNSNTKFSNKDIHFPVISSGLFQAPCAIMWAMRQAPTPAAWCYQKINPPMVRFKVRAAPRLQLITCRITGPLSQSVRLSHPWLKVRLRQGLKGLLCTDRNKDGSGLLMKPFQEGYLHLLKEDFLLHSNSRFSFWPPGCDANLTF